MTQCSATREDESRSERCSERRHGDADAGRDDADSERAAAGCCVDIAARTSTKRQEVLADRGDGGPARGGRGGGRAVRYQRRPDISSGRLRARHIG